MGQTLTEIAETLRGANKKVQLIYAFKAQVKHDYLVSLKS